MRNPCQAQTSLQRNGHAQISERMITYFKWGTNKIRKVTVSPSHSILQESDKGIILRLQHKIWPESWPYTIGKSLERSIMIAQINGWNLTLGSNRNAGALRGERGWATGPSAFIVVLLWLWWWLVSAIWAIIPGKVAATFRFRWLSRALTWPPLHHIFTLMDPRARYVPSCMTALEGAFNGIFLLAHSDEFWGRLATQCCLKK